MFSKRFALWAIVLLLIFAGVACGGAANPTAAPPTAAPAATNPPAATSTNLQIGFSVWVGYGPLFVARDKGYFKDEGLNVDLVKVADPKERFSALVGKKLDGLVSTVDTMTLYWKPETPFKAVLGLDDSSGGDGIVSKPDINSITDLKGKTVGVNVGSVSHFFLDFLLQKNGLTDGDLKIVKMSQDDVPAAFATGKIDAGVTWEPALSKAVKGGAKLLASSKETPGLIVDVLILRGDVLQSNPDAAKKLINAWNKAIDYIKSNPDDSYSIMQKGLGGFYEKPADIKADLQGATLYDAARNKQFFSGNGSGTALSTAKFAIDLWTKLGQLTTPEKPEDLVDGSYIQ
jgi:NitT/TauT family transport system substrate-binding protein